MTTTTSTSSSFNETEINQAVTAFHFNAKTVKQASAEMHKALVVIAADAFETGDHTKLRRIVNGEHVSLAYKTAIARFLNNHLPHAKAIVKTGGTFDFHFAKAHKDEKRFVRDDVAFMAELFNHPFYEIISGAATPEELAVFDDEIVVKLIKNAFNRVTRTAGLDSEKLAKKGYSSVNVDFEKIEAAKAALKAIGIDVNAV